MMSIDGTPNRVLTVCLPLAGALIIPLLIPTLVTAQASKRAADRPATIYWCPNRPADQQIAARPDSGCTPLVDTSGKARKADGTSQKTLPPIKIDQIQTEATQFLDRYNAFLDCCADDVTELDRITDLDAEASHILESIQSSGIYNTGTVVRQFTLGEIVRQVAHARRDLRTLHTRLERIGKGLDRLDTLEPDEAERTARELEADRETISRDFKPKRAAGSARTGVNIQDTTVPNWYGTSPTGSSTLRSTTGTDLGEQSNLATRPGETIRDTTLSDRAGSSAGETTLPSSTGFGIGTTQNPGGYSTTPTRVGPDLGDSSLNR